MKLSRQSVLQFFAGGCFLICGILLYSNVFSPKESIAYKTNIVIREYRPRVQSFVANNQAILDDILHNWMSYCTQQDLDLSSGSLSYMILSKDSAEVWNDEMASDGIPDELLQKLKRIEGDDTENIIISFISDGIVINFGRFSHTDVLIFSSKRWSDKCIPDEESVFQLENGWIVAFIGVGRG